MVLKDGRLAFIDFGMVGSLSDEMKQQLASLIIGLMRKDTDSMIRAIEKLGMMPDDMDARALHVDLDKLRTKYYDIPFSKISVGQALNDLFGIAQKHRVVMPADILLMGKSLLTVEGVIEHLDPTLSIVDMAEPFGRKLLKERFSAGRIKIGCFAVRQTWPKVSLVCRGSYGSCPPSSAKANCGWRSAFPNSSHLCADWIRSAIVYRSALYCSPSVSSWWDLLSVLRLVTNPRCFGIFR